MIKIPAKSFVPVIAILLSSIVLTFFLIFPLIARLQDIVDFYEPALNETTPTIHIKDGHIELLGHIPQRITLANGAIIFFDDTVNDSLFDAAPFRSVFIAEHEMRIRNKTRIDTVSFESVTVDDDGTILHPLEIREKLFQYRNKVFAVIAIISVVGVALLVYIMVNFAAGIGIMVDAFSNGPHSFKQMLNLSSILLLSFTIVGIIFQINSFRTIKILIILYLALTGVLVYITTFLGRRFYDLADKK